MPALLSQAAGVDFTVICSDVIYPSGESGDYRTRFFRPYRDLDCPIFAVPGNHDWYDGLHGFMAHLCGLDVPRAPLEVGPGLRGRIARRLWRTTAQPGDADVAGRMRAERSRERRSAHPPQPGPVLGPRRRPGADRRHRHGHRRRDRRRAGGVAAARLARLRPAEDPRDREAAHRQREATLAGVGRGGSATSCATRGPAT